MIHGFSELDASSIDATSSTVTRKAGAASSQLNSGRRSRCAAYLRLHARAGDPANCSEPQPGPGGTTTAPRLGASLAYYTLFAIAPVLLVATAIAGMVFGAEAVRGEIVGQLDHLVGREGALAVQSLLEGASQRRAGIFATVIGGITFLVAATGAFLELQVALNTIWRVKPRPGGHLYAFVIDRAALVRPGGGDRLPAAGVARGDRGAGRAQRLALRPLPSHRARCGAPSTRWCRSW